MEFKKYQHIERFGTPEVQGIEYGECYIFPKLDGTNSQIWVDENGKIRAGSRNRALALDSDHQGFYASVINDERFIRFFNNFPLARLYGEWLVPHTFKQYNDNAWRKFYVFDVEVGDKQEPYDSYSKLLDEFSIDYIPPICKIKNPSYEKLIELLDKATYCVKDGCGAGEGIVIKNYDYVNKYGRQTWAKIVRNEFKANLSRCKVTEMKAKPLVEQKIVDKYVTKALVDKEVAKIDEFNPKKIPQLLGVIYYCLITEESWHFIKEHKNPIIDFKRMYYLVINKVKELLPEYF